MIYPMILKKRQILQTLRGFYIHGQGQILMTLSALTYEPHLILYTHQIVLSGISFVSHIESRFYTLAYMFIAVLPWANPSVGAGDSLYSGWVRPGGGTRSENWWGCAAGRWKLDPKRSREKWNLGPKRSNSLRIGSFNTPKEVGGWEKIPPKDRARSCQSEKRGSKPRHICITHHIGSTPPPPPRGYVW